MGYNQNYSGGTPAAGGGGNILTPHDNTISGGATWAWSLDGVGTEDVVGGSPVDLTLVGDVFHASGPGTAPALYDAKRSTTAVTGNIGATVRIHTAITVAAWVCRTGTGSGNTAICGARDTGAAEANNIQWELGFENASNKVRVVWQQGSGTSVACVASVALALDTWEHWTFTRPTAGTSCKIYKNGVIDGTEFTGLVKATGGTSVNYISVGQNDSGGAAFPGLMFSPIVFEEELPSATFLALYHSTASTAAW